MPYTTTDPKSLPAVAIVGGLICCFGGLSLLSLTAAGSNSMIEAIAHGLGIYCLGKGVFSIGAALNFRAAIETILQDGRKP